MSKVNQIFKKVRHKYDVIIASGSVMVDYPEWTILRYNNERYIGIKNLLERFYSPNLLNVIPDTVYDLDKKSLVDVPEDALQIIKQQIMDIIKNEEQKMLRFSNAIDAISH